MEDQSFVIVQLLFYVVLTTNVVVKAQETNDAHSTEFCHKNCYKDFTELSDVEKCKEAKAAECIMSRTSLIINIVIGILVLVAVCAVCLRCCLAAKLLRGRRKKKAEDLEDGQKESQDTLQYNSITPALATKV